MTDKLDKFCDGVVKKLENNETPAKKLFEKFCDEVDEWCEQNDKAAYIRILWYDELGTSEIEEIVNEISETYEEFDIEEHYTRSSDIFECCFFVAIYERTR